MRGSPVLSRLCYFIMIRRTAPSCCLQRISVLPARSGIDLCPYQQQFQRIGYSLFATRKATSNSANAAPMSSTSSFSIFSSSLGTSSSSVRGCCSARLDRDASRRCAAASLAFWAFLADFRLFSSRRDFSVASKSFACCFLSCSNLRVSACLVSL